jgi:glycosyltransferase involved in cell wall biosynthesis
MQIKVIFVITIKITDFCNIRAKRMKVLMILERDFPNDDRVEKEAISLIRAGHQVNIVCFTLKGISRTEQYKGITVIKRRISKFVYRSSVGALRLPFYFSFWKKVLTEHLESYQYQVLHLHDLPLAQVVQQLSRVYNCRYILDLHENYPALLQISPHTKKLVGRLVHSNRQWEKYEKVNVALADGLVTVVREMKERIMPYATCDIAVLENTPYLEELKTMDDQSDRNFITLVYSGGINYHRGLQTVIEGIKLSVKVNPEIRLFILGGGSHEEMLKKQVKLAGLEDHVRFFGWLNSNEMYEQLYKSDIALIPHMKSVQSDNSSPNKLFQYMFCGKPILASNCNSVERVLHETKTGITYIHDSPESFKEALLQLISEMPFDSYKENGRKALEKYNWEHSVQELIALYKRLDTPGK